MQRCATACEQQRTRSRRTHRWRYQASELRGRDKVHSDRALALSQVELISGPLLQRERVVDERCRIAVGPGTNLLNRILCGRRVSEIDDKGRGGDARVADLGVQLRQPRGISRQQRDCEPLAAARVGWWCARITAWICGWVCASPGA